MKTRQIESLPEVREAASVLAALEAKGLVEPCIASGWLRGYLTDVTPSDIDVSYVGPVPPEDARRHLQETLDELGVASGDWDIDGIWNAQTAYGVTHTVENYLLYYVSSIDTVYLAADGQLHDPTGHGFTDAQQKVLRLNNHDRSDGRTPTPKEDVYICLEGCRRMAKFGWTPTADSVERIRQGVEQWKLLSPDEQRYYITKKILGKYSLEQRQRIRPVYDKYGWGFILELADAR